MVKETFKQLHYFKTPIVSVAQNEDDESGLQFFIIRKENLDFLNQEYTIFFGIWLKRLGKTQFDLSRCFKKTF